ncbi:hypothetical protein DPEC_G00210240 [Dallia pectoralis]|uniref:Uncharacterized protein n=1 Tax=Dallia pectoralis TaxID=75939 RepID=A0ACC2G656_DALPE|nr:hypothetical protein DPEC_G00210240 [Dallia pectoralis]
MGTQRIFTPQYPVRFYGRLPTDTGVGFCKLEFKNQPDRMTSTPSEEMELNKKHEEILGQRAVLLLQMESQYEQQRRTRKQQVMMSQVALERNAQLLQGLQEMENRHGTKQLPHPEILTLETRYWASVEEKIPEWERFLLEFPPYIAMFTSYTYTRCVTLWSVF